MALLFGTLVLGFAWASLGDQLQWNPLSVCRGAAKLIGGRPLLVSFCSRADEDFVGLWSVKDVNVSATPVRDLYEVVVSAELLYRSDRAHSSDEFPVSEEQWALHAAKGLEAFAGGVDLAYVYIHIGGGSFRCLGKVLWLDCVVGVEIIHIPAQVLEDIAAAFKAKRHKTWWPLGEASERCPFHGRRVSTRG